MTALDWVVQPNPAAVGRYAADRAADFLSTRASTAHRVTVALAGGSTPRHLHRALAGPLAPKIPWSQLLFFLGDERAVPPNHESSNFRAAQETLFSRAPIQTSQVHRPRAEAQDLEAAAREYEQTLKAITGTPPQLDLVFLGMGSDGHTASLFPGEPEPDGWFAVTRAPRGTASERRLTMTHRTLLGAREVVVMVTGEAKADRIAQVMKGDGSLPMQRVLHHRSGGTLVIMDEAAAARVSQDAL